MPEVYLGLGSNLGDNEQNLRQALARLQEQCELVRISPIYRTEPVGYADQDWFLNGVAQMRTCLAPQDLLRFLRSIETALGRIERVRNGPRIIDLDILFYGDEVVGEDGLEIPHPRLHERLFVLAPLNELAPELVHPVLKKSVRELLFSLQEWERVELYCSELVLEG